MIFEVLYDGKPGEYGQVARFLSRADACAFAAVHTCDGFRCTLGEISDAPAALRAAWGFS